MGYTFLGHEPDHLACRDLPESAIRIQLVLNSPDEIFKNEHVLDHCSKNDPERPRQVTLPQSQPQTEERQAFPCLQAGCNKIYKSLGGLALHVKRVHGAKNT